jgi:hypothetical protein
MNIPNIKYLVLILALLVIAMCVTVKAQNKPTAGADLSMQFAGNGTGATYSPGLYLATERYQINLGLNLQSNNRSVSGMNVTLRKNISLECENFSDRVTLYYFATGVYHHNAFIGKTTEMVYSNLSKEYADVDKINYCIGELYGGAGISNRISSRSFISMSFGAGMYYTVNTNCSQPVPDAFKNYRSDKDISLFFKVGYSYQIK